MTTVDVDDDQFVDEPTLLKALLRVRHWQKRETFSRQWDKAAKTLDSSLVGTCPAHAQFYRWLSGNVRSMPHPDACRILEAMFPGVTVRQLFRPVRARRSELLEPSRGQLAASNSSAASAVSPAFPTTSALEADRLSPRMESLFLARGAHALAQQQQHADAVRTFQKARARYLDGPRDDDPAWAFWVDDRQFSWFEAMVQAQLGDWDKSVHPFAEALATSPQHRVRRRYSRSAYLFDALVRVGDWREAEQLIPTLAPYISEVGSGHTTSILRKTLRAVRAATTTPTLEDGVVAEGIGERAEDFTKGCRRLSRSRSDATRGRRAARGCRSAARRSRSATRSVAILPRPVPTRPARLR